MLPTIGKMVNLKYVPADDEKPAHKEATTADFGPFLPGEIKRVKDSDKVDRLLRSGEFEVTDEDPNSEELRKEISTARAKGELED